VPPLRAGDWRAGGGAVRPLTTAESDALVNWAESKAGCWYCWPTKENGYSGKWLKGAKYPETSDCSGLVTGALYFGVKGPDWRATHNAQRLMGLCKPVVAPRPGDLAFYGPGKNAINHVMVVQAGGRVFGACSGNSDTTSPEIARKKGAYVRSRQSHLYRPDFRGFGRLQVPGQEE
jgi:murein DD-endopeptidase